MEIIKYNMINKLKVVRWSTKIIPANELEFQFFNWGGFDATALSFTPYTNENDYRFTYWKNDVEKHHKQKVYPNKYLLDLTNFPYKTEKELTIVGLQAYSDFDLEKYLQKDLGIMLTLSGKEIVEFRIYDYCKLIKILDDK